MAGMDPQLKAKLQKQRYHIVGEHGGVKTCHWTKESLLRDRQCYKGKFYGVASHNCMQMSPVVDQCNLACTYCWREPHMDTLELTDQDPLDLLYESVRAQRRLLSGFGGNPKCLARSGWTLRTRSTWRFHSTGSRHSTPDFLNTWTCATSTA